MNRLQKFVRGLRQHPPPRPLTNRSRMKTTPWPGDSLPVWGACFDVEVSNRLTFLPGESPIRFPVSVRHVPRGPHGE